MSETLHCPLCSNEDSTDFCEDRHRLYRRCERCALVFVPPKFYLSEHAERAEYDLHENDIYDEGYRTFLSRLAEPLLARLKPASRGLDFGCGPGPALAAMLEEAGHTVNLYDVFYAPDMAALSSSYDFICATEVVEHLHRPGEQLAKLWRLLSPKGHLGVMTKLVKDQAAFASWHYKNDMTHVCFFSETTWQWWAAQNEAELIFIGSDVMLFNKR